MKSEPTDPQDSFKLASKTVSDAVEYDNKHNYKEAHALYVKAVGLFEESMEAEGNETKLNVLKNRTAAYKKRAAELDSFLKASNLKSAAPVCINDLAFEIKGISKTFPDAGEGQATSKVDNEHRLERMVYGLGVLVGVLLMSVIALFVLLHVHIANTSDYVTTGELDVTQANLNTVANAVLRMSMSDASLEAKSGDDTVFNDLDSIISGDVQGVTAEIEELKVQLASVRVILDAKADHASVYTVESIDAFVSSLTTNTDNKVGLAQVKLGLVETRLNEVDLGLSSAISGISGSVNDLSKTVGNLIGEVEALEKGMVLKADASVLETKVNESQAAAMIASAVKELNLPSILASISAVVADLDAEEAARIKEDNLKVSESRAAAMITSAVNGLDKPSILASISAEEAARVREDNLKVSRVAYDLKMADLDRKFLAMPRPIACSWIGTRELFGGNEGCADDLLLDCTSGVITSLKMRC